MVELPKLLQLWAQKGNNWGNTCPFLLHSPPVIIRHLKFLSTSASFCITALGSYGFFSQIFLSARPKLKSISLLSFFLSSHSNSCVPALWTPVVINCAGAAHSFHMQLCQSDLSQAEAHGRVHRSGLMICRKLDAVVFIVDSWDLAENREMKTVRPMTHLFWSITIETDNPSKVRVDKASLQDGM